jgi:hypothetical protein
VGRPREGQVEEVVAREEVARARDGKGSGRGTGCDDDLVAGVVPSTDTDLVAAGEVRPSPDQVDSACFQALLELRGHARYEALLACHEAGPIEAGTTHRDLVGAGTFDGVERLRCRDQHLLRDTASKRADSADIPPFDQQHAPARGARDPGRGEPSVSRSQHQYVIVVCHPDLPGPL